MAITWHVAVTNCNIATGRADVNATRINSELPESLATTTYSMTNTPFLTPEQRAYALDGLKGWVEQEKARDVAAKMFAANFEQESKIALELWETTRV